MNKAKRAAVLAGNWKMNKTAKEAAALLDELIPAVRDAGCDVVVCVPFTDLGVAVQKCAGTNVKVGAQNCHFMESGAYTGEISPGMLKEAGVEYVIVGHSERRQYFGETDETVNLRAAAAIAKGLTAIICVGELLAEREAGVTGEVVDRQTRTALHGMSRDDLQKVIIAYEPVWAIGTGKTATSAEAAEVCGLIRGIVENLYGREAAEGLTIQYGGSMNPSNAAELLANEDVDGGLIGGASLKANDFRALTEAASR